MIQRRALLAIAGTLTAVPFARKPLAAERLPELAQTLQKRQPPARPPSIVFTDASGAAHSLEEFRGRGMVVNLWATWCVPCVAEMPSLEVLSRALAASDIAVLPLSSDRGGVAKVTAFYRERGITALPILLDPRGAIGQAWGIVGIPTTLLIDRQGREVARVGGAADWSTPQATTLVRTLLS